MDQIYFSCNQKEDMFYATRMYDGDEIIIRVFYNKNQCKNYCIDKNYELEHPDIYPEEEETNEQKIQYERDDARARA